MNQRVSQKTKRDMEMVMDMSECKTWDDLYQELIQCYYKVRSAEHKSV